jgi:hypothetical protein
MIPPEFSNQSSIDNLSFARRRTPGDKGVVMSRNLPPHPNLEHLKKQAKDLLPDLKQRNPNAKLADAQYALAREYGFASWPKLGAYVESLSTTTELEKANPFVGKWIANLSKSKRHPSNPFRSATIEFAVDGDIVTIMDVVVDESGHEVSGKNTILIDGVEHSPNHGYVLVARWNGPRIIETLAKKDNQVVGWGKYEVSDDGQSLIITGDKQMIVLDRS